MAISSQKKISNVRKPRVHITYEVETNDATEKKELPFVAGVMGDFSGNNPGEALKPFKERKFVQIDNDNFDDVMGKIKPGVSIKVENTLKGDNSETGVNLQFNSMEDFEPDNIAQQVPALKKLLETRAKLNEILTKTDLSEELEGILEEVLQNTGDLDQLAKELGARDKTEENA